MIRVSEALLIALRRSRRNGCLPGSVYLTRADTDQLLEEMGQKRDGRCTRRPAIDRFDGVPVYPDKDVSMVVFCDAESRTGHIAL